jgi:hypothetical protein
MPTQLEVEIARNEARRYDQLMTGVAGVLATVTKRDGNQPGDVAAVQRTFEIVSTLHAQAAQAYRSKLEAHQAELRAVELELTRRQREILLEVSLGATLDSMYLSFHTSKTSPHRSSEAVDYRRTIKPLVACGYLTPVNNERGYLAHYAITRKGLAIFGREAEATA